MSARAAAATLAALADEAAVSVAQVSEWAGTTDAGQLEEIIAAIPLSSIPDAIAEIADAVAASADDAGPPDA